MPETLLILFAIFGAVLIWGIGSVRTYARMWSLYYRLTQTKPLFIQWPIQCQLIDAGAGKLIGWRPFLLMLTEAGITFSPKSPSPEDNWTFSPSGLRWFGRPQKYRPGDNELWMHFEAEGRWQTLKVRASQHTIMGLVRALKQVASEEQVIAYRRRGYHVHYGPMEALLALQDIHGEWTMQERVKLLLTPVALVFIWRNEVVRTLPLVDIDQIGAVPRLDHPDEHGLVRFKMQGEEFAFALSKHEEFARLLALAAKRSLEDPQMVKGKKADEEEEELVFEEIPDESQEILEAGFYIGDDGEIHLRGA